MLDQTNAQCAKPESMREFPALQHVLHVRQMHSLREEAQHEDRAHVTQGFFLEAMVSGANYVWTAGLCSRLVQTGLCLRQVRSISGFKIWTETILAI